MIKNKSKTFISIFSISLFLLISLNVGAQTIDLNQIIEHGINNNHEIKSIESEIESLKRNIEMIKSSDDWQVNVTLNKLLTDQDNQLLNRDNDQINLSANKKLINNKLILSPSATYDFDGSEIIYGVSMNMNVYPDTPSESTKNIIKLNNQLNQKYKELNTKKSELVKEWLNNYLQLIRLDNNLDLLKQRQKIINNRYLDIQKNLEINEASEQDILEAELNIKEIEYNITENNQQFTHIKHTLLTNTNLDRNLTLVLSSENEIITKLKKYTQNIDIDSLNKEKLIENVLNNSSQFVSIINQIDYLNSELSWLEKENDPQLSISSSYDSQTELKALLSVSYDIFDSGVQKLKVEDKKQQISDAESSLDQLYKNTELSVESILNKIELAKLNQIRSELSYNKAADETDIYLQQYKIGAINENIYKDKVINEKISLNNLKQAEDNLLMNKLDLLIITNPELILEEVSNL